MPRGNEEGCEREQRNVCFGSEADVGENVPHMYATQSDYTVRFEWGMPAVKHLARLADLTVIVDVLSFSTCVDIACARDGVVFPFEYGDERATAFTKDQGGILASARGGDGPSLSPKSLLALQPGTRLVLPSPNGASIARATQSKTVVAACFRNRLAIARFAANCASVLVVGAGERWPDGLLRPAVEDFVAAGAIINVLNGSKSPEALAANAAYEAISASFERELRGCASARELIERGFEGDLELAFDLDSSDCVPLLLRGAFTARKS